MMLARHTRSRASGLLGCSTVGAAAAGLPSTGSLKADRLATWLCHAKLSTTDSGALRRPRF
jgi:hypothetical protein